MLTLVPRFGTGSADPSEADRVAKQAVEGAYKRRPSPVNDRRASVGARAAELLRGRPGASGVTVRRAIS